jgi:DNA-binding CsgD family transcriptional regulator
MDPRASDIASSIFEAAIAIDEHMTIVACNGSAAALLGRRASDVIGKPCNEVVHAGDIFGNRYCDEECAIMKMARCHEAVHPTRLDIPSASGGCARTDVLTLRVPGAGRSSFTLVHVFLPARERSESAGWSEADLAAVPTQPATSPEPAIASLSARERQILRLLANGSRTREIATALSIAPSTARNHVQHVLQKLDVHTKTAAVAFALRHGLT